MRRFISLAAMLTALSAFSYPAARAEREVEGEISYPEFDEDMLGTLIDVNRAGMEDLMKLPGVGPSAARSILEARSRAGKFASKRDLLERGAVTEELYDVIAPYITAVFDGNRRAEEISLRIRSSGSWSAGTGHPVPWGNYLRAKWSRGERWRAGVLADRDPGESRLVDNLKWSLSYDRKSGPVEKLVAGNLRYELSRGLLFFTRSRASKGSLVPGSAGRRGRGLGVDLSTTEGYVLRGLGLKIRLSDPVSLTILASSTPLDVSRDESGRAVSIRTSGYHTSSFTGERGGMGLFTFAGHADAGLGSFGNCGFTVADLKYTEPLLPLPEEGNYHRFRGSRRDFAGFDWDIILSGMGLFGEVVHELRRGTGIQAGVERGTGPTRWSILYRDYSPDFFPPFGNPLQDGTGAPGNERGFFTSLGFKLTPTVKMSLYIDACRRAWRRTDEPFPQERGEAFLEGRWRPVGGVQVVLRVSEKRGDSAMPVDHLRKNRKNLRRSLRMQMEWGSNRVRMRGRYEHVISAWSPVNGEHGDLLYLDTRIRPRDSWNFDLRVMVFGSDSISSAVYEYETDLPGLMRVLPMTGEGVRWYINVKWCGGRRWSVSAKYGETSRYADGGPETFLGGELTDRSFGVQLDLETAR